MVHPVDSRPRRAADDRHRHPVSRSVPVYGLPQAFETGRKILLAGPGREVGAHPAVCDGENPAVSFGQERHGADGVAGSFASRLVSARYGDDRLRADKSHLEGAVEPAVVTAVVALQKLALEAG